MSDNLQDRPATLSRKPRPAPDERVDPVDYPQPPATPAKPKAQEAPAPVQKKRKREATFPFSTRLSEEVLGILEDAVAREGITIRDAVEQAIRGRWGSAS
ncbi:hypothetical protein SAMN04488693_11936 [Arthrobacter subterraneus]|uniref:Uncharacterized protein n=1 Tax=Arthrobacter subterraneus TaxID=335973 RepID=A0A1G8MS07_9MICC|nr:hypothetical protein [Arthrobacter subterraneus]SDI70605.1 hypothetical protein SAMN04488693_11936 [Arthrobacter subterraneus]